MRRVFPLSAPPRRSPISAFTLIEVLLAVLIASLVLGATYSVYLAASQTWHRSRSASFNHQYARAAFALIEQHLRSALPPDSTTGVTFEGLDTEPPEILSAPSDPPPSSPSTPPGVPTANTASTDYTGEELTETLVDRLFPPEEPLEFRTTSPALNPNDTEQEPWLQSDSLQFVSTGQVHGAGTHNRADLCELRLFLAPPNATELPRLALLRNIVPTGNFTEPDTQNDPLATQDEQATQTQSSQWVELAPNVVNFDVVYFDGTEWIAEWTGRQTLPPAVEITLVLADPDGVSDPLVLSKLISLNLASMPTSEVPDETDTPEDVPNEDRSGEPPRNAPPPSNGPPRGDAPPPQGGENRP